MAGIEFDVKPTVVSAPTAVSTEAPAATHDEAPAQDSNLWRNLGIGVGLGSVALAIGGVVAIRKGHLQGLKRFLPAVGVAGGAALLAGCSSGYGDGKTEIPAKDRTKSPPAPDAATNDAYAKQQAQFQTDHEAWTKNRDTFNDAVATVLTPAPAVPGITGERAGTQNRLIALPASKFVEHWTSSTSGSAQTNGGGQYADSSSGASRTYDTADWDRAVVNAQQATGSGVWSDRSVTDIRSSTNTDGSGMTWSYETRGTGTSLGAPLGTRGYANIDDAIATLVTTARAAGKQLGTIALVETPDGLRPFTVAQEFQATDAHNPIMITNPAIKAVLTAGNLYVPTKALNNLADGAENSAQLFEFQAPLSDRASLGSAQVAATAVGVEPKAPVPPAGTWAPPAHGPDIQGPYVGAVSIGHSKKSSNGDFRLGLHVEFADGKAKAGYSSLDQAKTELFAKGHSGIIYKVDDNYYTSATSLSESDDKFTIDDPNPKLQEVRVYEWDGARDIVTERVADLTKK